MSQAKTKKRGYSMRCVTVAVGVLLLGGVGLVCSGELEPTAPPGDTMKSLDEIPPTWSQKLDSTDGGTIIPWIGCGSSRFDCLWPTGSPTPIPQAVLDKETGLVWERSPSTSTGFAWSTAFDNCHGEEVGGRYGWRTPTVEELASLVDPSQTSPSLPAGHPFLNVLTDAGYWTSSTRHFDDTDAFVVDFGSGIAHVYVSDKALEKARWCVRGGNGYDGR